MDFKVNEIQQAAPVQQTQAVQQTDDTFKFMLASNIEEAGLAERLNLMMEEIVMQGDKIVKRMDVRDMKRYRTLIKEFMNEIVNRSHKFSRENFWTGVDATGFMGLSGLWMRSLMNLRRSL